MSAKNQTSQTSLSQDSLGEKITLSEANEMIDLHNKIQEIIEMKVVKEAPSELFSKANVMIGKKYNAFIFTKDLIQRFFDGSEEDLDGNPISSNFLMVLLGAHPTAKNGFEAGSFTVLTAGCKRKKVDEKGHEEIRFYPLNIPKPANEYPPTTVVTILKKSIEGDQIEYFLPIQ